MQAYEHCGEESAEEVTAAAYGWPAEISDDEALRRLFELNQARAAA